MRTINEIRAKFPQYSDLSDSQLADALYKKYYSDLPRDEFDSKIGLKQTPVAPSTDRSWFEAIKDVPASALTGVGGLLQFPGQLVQLIPGLNQAGQALQKPGEYIQEFGKDLKSAGLRAREALRSQALSEAEKEGFLSEFATAITSTIKDPALITSFIAEQVPLLLGPAGAARLATKLGMAGIESAGAAAAKGLTGTAAEVASKEAMEAAATKLGRTATGAAIGTGTAMQAADVGSDTYNEAYKRAIERGMNPQEAESAALNAARIAAGGAAVASLGANLGLSKIGGTAIERALAGRPGQGRVKGFFGESISEGAEEGFGKGFSNVGLQTVDPNQPLMQGVGAATGMGVLGGGVFGTLLSSSTTENLAPGQRPGESLYQTANRLNQEIKNIEDLAKMSDAGAIPPSGIRDIGQLFDLASMPADQGGGYVGVQKYLQTLSAMPPSPERDQAISDTKQLLNRMNIESAERQAQTQTNNVITAKDLQTLGFKYTDPIYKELLGKNIGKPDDAQAAITSIENALQAKGLRQTQAARLAVLRQAIDLYLETVPGGGFYAQPTIDTTGGDGTGVVGVPAAGATTAGSGAAKPSRVVPAEPAIEEPAGGKAEPTTPVMEDDITPQKVEKVWQTQPDFVLADYPIDAEILNLRRIKESSDRQNMAIDVEGMASDALKASGRLQEVFEKAPAPTAPAPKTDDELLSEATDEQLGQAMLERDPDKNPVSAIYPGKIQAEIDRRKTAAAVAAPSVSELPKEITEDKLPKDLAGAKPRFAYGPKQFQLTFENDIAKALFITAQATPSKRDADYRAWLTERGFEPEQIELAGKRIRERIKTLAKNADPEAGPIRVPFVTKPVQGKFSLAPEVKDKLEPIYKRLEQRVKTAKPEAKQEAKPEEAKAEAPKEKTQKDLLLERRAELVKQLDGILKKILAKYNLTGVKLNLEEGMAEEGSYSGQIIKLALNLDNPVRVLRHESIHALKDMGFFSDAQWKTLVKRARDEWVEKYLKNKAHTETQSRYDAYVELLTKEGLNPTEVQEAIIEEAIADAFGDFDVNGAPPGLLAAIHRRMKSLFKAIKEAFGLAGIDTAEEIFGKIEKGSLKPAIPVGKQKSGKFNAWKATEADVEKAEAYEEKNGIKPYLSEGRLDLPTKYSIKTNVDKYGQDPILGIPLNKDGTVTVYYHTVKPNVFQINSSKIIPAEGRDRIYLTNESSGAKVYGKRGNFDQELDGSVVLLNINPSLLQIDQEYDDGRKDFFVPLTQGDFFNKKMQAAAIQAPRTKAIVEEFSYKDHQDRITGAVEKYNALTGKEKQALLKKARAVLKKEHNIGTLMTENGKLEKTRMGDYGLLWEGKPIDSMGLGLAAAQQISEKLSTCPNSAICQGLCLGETSGGNFLYGGAAREDVEDIEKTAFRAGPRMVQYLKTEALIVHPEEFAIVLQSEIDTLKKWDNSPTYRKKNKETGKLETLDKEIYQSAVRLNVTSDFRPEMWSSLFEANPDVMFYDYTKMLGNTPIAPNHHLTFSSTGFGQKIDGEDVFFKTKSGRYDHNWPQVRNRLNAGYNVAMAFSSKSALPKTLVDEETGVTYNILDGDDYDARFLDEKSPLKQGGIGVIVGLRNKASTLKEKTASKETDGFFVDYDPKRDGDSVTVPDQTQFGAPAYKAPAKTIPIEKKSLRSQTPEFKFWFGQSKIVDKDGKPKVMYHGTGKDITSFEGKTARGAPIFLTDEPDVARSFASDSQAFVRNKLAEEAPFEIRKQKAYELLDKLKRTAFKGPEYKTRIQNLEVSLAQGRLNDVIFLDEEGYSRLFADMVPSGANIMPLYVKAEYPFDYDKTSDLLAIVATPSGKKLSENKLSSIAAGAWDIIETPDVQRAIKEAGFDSFYVREEGKKNLAVYSPTQVVSAIGNVGAYRQRPITAEEAARFGMTEEQAADAQKRGDIRFSLRAKPFDPANLPENNKDYILPQDTILYHGAYKSVADAIKSVNYLMSRPAMKAHGGTRDEGGLVWFGSEKTAQNYADSKADPMKVKFDREEGIIREPGQVFQAITDKPYRLISRKKVLSESEAEDLNEALGLPDYKSLDAGDSADTAASRAYDYQRSNIDRYKITIGQSEQEMAAPWPVILKTLKADGFYSGNTVALTAENGIRLSEDGKPMERFSLRSPIGLYSELENKVEAVSSKAAPAGQWKTMIAAMTQKGVKPEEIEWSGVNDWLDLQTGKVTKDDLLEYLRANGVQVEEVQLGGRESWRQELDILENRGRINLNAQERERYDELMDRRRKEGLPADEAPAKYQDYTLPGGENYREVLLTLPEQKPSINTNGWTAKVVKAKSPVTGMPEFEIYDKDGEYLGKTFNQKDSKSAINQVASRHYEAEKRKVNYKSPHWAQTNVLAHVRVNDRTDANGNKVLFVEEIQSDWGQEGKKKGFIDKQAEERARVAYEKAKKINDDALMAGDYEKFQATKAAREKAHDAYIEASKVNVRGQIPTAPFVTKTEGWLNLALKRIMIMAAEGGYDKVAFINGEQSADRYDLSKQVSQIIWSPTSETLIATPVSGGQRIERNNVKEEDLPNIIGKEAAQKLLSSEKVPTTGYHRLMGDSLKVGGEGMKTFYDQIVPTALKKLLPKVGGGEMKTIDFSALGLGRFAVFDEDSGNLVWRGKTKKEAEEFLSSYTGYGFIKEGSREYDTFGGQQIGFDVTPAMKEKVATTGLPKFSLRSTLPASVVKSMDKIAPPRYEPNLAERMMNAVSGDGFTRIRQHFLNRYEALAALDRRVAAFLKKTGGAKQYADSKAETAALFSDLSAGVLESVMGVHDGVGGAPIFRNGVTTVSNYGGAVKGLLEIFRPLSNMRSPEAFNLFQTWAAVKRGTRLTVEGREDLVDQADVKAMQDLQRSNPDIIKTFEAVQKDWLAYNNALIKYMKDTGVISPAMAKKWTEHGDYWPFYRLTAEEDIVGPKAFMSIGNVTPPKKLKKSENPLGDFFENVVRNSQSAIQAGMKNVAAQNATKQGLMLGEVVRLKGREPGVHVYRVFENGKEVFYRAADPLFIEAIKALNMADIPFLGFLAKPAAWLRNLVTKDPAFMLANMMRDSLSAWVTTGKNITPIYSTLRNFSQALAGQSPYINELYAAGLLGGYDYATGTKDAARVFEKTLRQKAGQKTVLERAATPVTSLWEALEKGTQASDAATRIEIYKKVLAETGNEAEALSQALEVMNFNRKGNSALIRVLTAAVPFLNARLQGLDVLYRSAIQPLVLGNASEEAKQRMKTFWMRGMLMVGTSMMYWLLTHDDDEYKKQEQETRDDNWLIPSLGIRIPIPFEVGVLFKVLPERIMELNFGGDTTKDFTLSMKRQFLNTFAFNPMPQTVKPLYEVATNHSFFTQRPIIGMGMERVAERYQIGPSTSKTAQFLGEISGEISSKLKEKDSFIISKMIGESVGLSPMKIDYLIKGYTGTIGTYISDLIDMIWDMNSDAPKASKRFEQMPVIKRFALDPDARGTVTQYYKLKDDVDSAVRTANFLERSNNFSEYTKYSIENKKLLASKDYINSIEQSMKDYQDMKLRIQSAPFSAETKKNLLLAISRMESRTTKNIQTIKKFSQP